MSLQRGHRVLWWLAVILWLLTIALLSYQLWHHSLQVPIFSYNRPHGVLGWLGMLAVLTSMASAAVKRVINFRLPK